MMDTSYLTQPAGVAPIPPPVIPPFGGYGPWGGNMFGVQNPSAYGASPQSGPAAASPASATPAAPSTSIQQQFMPPQLLAPYYNMSGVAGNLGTMVGSAAPAASQFLGSLFSPELNPMAQAYMQAGMGNALTGLEQGMIRQEEQFEGTPFHSALPRAQGETMEQFSRNAMQTGAQMGMQQQQLAAQAMPFTFQFPLQAAQAPVAAAEGMFNMANQAFMAPYQLPMQYYQQYPVQSPTVIAQPQQSGGGKG